MGEEGFDQAPPAAQQDALDLLAYLRREPGKQFDPEAVEAFPAVLRSVHVD